MKRIILITICFVALQLSAQGNLQFNQVINQSLVGSVGTTLQSVGSITVPAGKVWKIEAVSYTFVSVYRQNGTSGYWAYIGDYLVYDGYTGNFSNINNTFPLWLKAGTYDVTARASSSYPNGTVAISAIEFNVIP